MSKNVNVGRSWRTPAKHELISSIIGQEVGSASRIGKADRLVWFDLTAGDAALVDGEEWHRSCSPGILAYHAARSPKPVTIDLYEIQTATFDRLVTNLSEHLAPLGYVQTDYDRWFLRNGHVLVHAHNLSGRQASVGHVHRRDAVFVLNDPNAITEWAMRPSLAAEISRATWMFRSLSTMGCNPGGLKRIDLASRLDWFDTVQYQQDALPDHRDLVIAAIARDDAQWAYLINTAARWRATTEKVVTAAFRRYGRTAHMSWWRKDPTAFRDAKLHLFLQAKERPQISGREREWLAAGREERLAMIPRPEKPLGEDELAEWALFGLGEMGGAA